MKKQILLALSVLVAVSCVPANALTSWDITKSSLKMAGGLGLIYIGAINLRDFASLKTKKKRHEALLKARAELRELVEKGEGVDAKKFVETFKLVQKLEVQQDVSCLIGLGFTVWGLYLGYRGLAGLFPNPVVAQV